MKSQLTPIMLYFRLERLSTWRLKCYHLDCVKTVYEQATEVVSLIPVSRSFTRIEKDVEGSSSGQLRSGSLAYHIVILHFLLFLIEYLVNFFSSRYQNVCWKVYYNFLITLYFVFFCFKIRCIFVAKFRPHFCTHGRQTPVPSYLSIKNIYKVVSRVQGPVQSPVQVLANADGFEIARSYIGNQLDMSQ